MICLFCRHENVEDALVCVACSRDIAIPTKLLAERDDLIRKRDLIRTELRKARQELDQIRIRRNKRPA
ncbi:hypothetical protein [Bradyrhizobium cenepequi]